MGMEQFESTLVSPETPIREVIRVINENSMQIALVVDAQRLLVGTVTDGDIRRAILKGLAINDPVALAMNKKPVTANRSDNRERIIKKMIQRMFRHMPIVDDTGRVVGLEVLDELLRPAERSNAVVLMAGGLGQRMSPLTDDCPKPMLHVGNRPILETILEHFARYGFRKFFISVNYKAEMIEEYFGDGAKWGIEIEYIRDTERMGTAGALGLLPEKPSCATFVMNADLLTKVNFQQLLEFHIEQKAQLTMCVREFDFQVPYGVVKTEGHHILGIDEKPVQKFFVNAGIYVLEPIVFDSIPKSAFLDMPTLVQGLIDSKRRTAAFPLREYWVDIGERAEFERANGEYPGEFK